MSYYVRVILPLEFSEIEIPEGLTVYDASTWKFVPNRAHTESNFIVDVWEDSQVSAVIPLIRNAYNQSMQ